MRLLVGLVAALVLASPASAATKKKADLQVRTVALAGTTVSGTVKNAGKAKAGKSTLTITAGTTKLASVRVKALAAGKSAKFKATVKPTGLATGRYALRACADSAKKVKEAKETNNCRSTSAKLVVTAPPQPAPPAPAPITVPAPAPTSAPSTPAPTATATAVSGAPVITGGPTGDTNAKSATFAFTGAAPLECSLDGGPFAACTSPRTYGSLPGGAHSFTVRNALGSVSRTWTAAFDAPAPGPTPAPAADPKTRATAPAIGETTLIGDATAFLYTGANPIQTGVAPGTIAEQRAAVVRGRVLNRMNAPIAGVQVTVLGHPEYGRTATRDDGGFDLAVNGGGPLTISLARAGWISVQRTVEPAPQDYTAAEAITMVPYDDAVTGIDLDAPVPVQSSPVTDDDGTRRATLLFDAGTQATATLPDGTTKPLGDALNVRATEFTIGDSGPSAMPGELPPSSAYTYAVEYSVDEADALGATDVRFSKPVATYVDNFLGFAPGTPVPAGYYDRRQARWIAARNGVVIKIVSESGGVATVEGATLDEDERRTLARLYDPGKSLWRVEVDHFTPWDYNYPYGPPDGSGPPGMGGPNGPGDGSGCNSGGSIIGCEDQTLGEDAAIAGTPFTLRYASDRVPGRRSEMTLDIPLTPNTPPTSLKRVDLDIQVAGQTIHREFAPSAGASSSFTWDGKDAYGRVVNGQQPATVKLSYVYPTVYRAPAEFSQAFAQLGGSLVASNPTRTELSASQSWTVKVGGLQAPPSTIGGWNLDVHQVYDPVGQSLYAGDGSKRSADGQNFDVIRSEVAPPRSGARVSLELESPEGFVRAPDGALIIADTGANVIRRVGADGATSVLAGDGDAGFADGPVADAEFDAPSDVALGADGALFVADRGNHRIRRVFNGTVTTVAGGEQGFSGDGGPASAARFDEPTDVAVANDGTLYVVDRFNDRVRRIGPDGIITTALADLRAPGDVALRGDGGVFVADTGNHRILLLGADGTRTVVAGDGVARHRGDGGPAVSASLDRPSAVAPRPDGGFYIADAGNNVIRSVASDATISTVAGIVHSGGATGDKAAAPLAQIGFPQAIVAGSGSSFLFLDAGNDRIRKVEPAMPALGIGEFEIPSTAGDQLYVFSQAGRHVRTLDALTGTTLLTFGYDQGRLVSVTDEQGLETKIVRDAAGKPLRIEAPHGFVTQLATDANGYLSKIEDPAGGKLQMSYSAGGLLTGLTDPREGSHTFVYDEAGRLTQDRNAERGVQTLVRNAETGAVTMTTAEGRTTTYRTEELPTGELERTVTDPAGGTTVVTVGTDGVTSIERPTGERETYRLGPDPRFGMSAPIVRSITTLLPSGRERTAETTRTVDLANPADPLSVTRSVDTFTVNGRSSSVTYDAATRTMTGRSPSGAPSETVIDGGRRPLSFTLPGIEPVEFGYDGEGRITTRTQGDRVWRYEYNAAGLNSKTVDPEGNETTFLYDPAGRAVSRTLPGGRTVAIAFDAAGSVSSVTPPGAAAHGLTYTKQGLISSYTAPGATAMSLGYDKDDLLTEVNRPGTGDVSLTYTTGGRVSSVKEPGRGDTVSFDYAGPTTRRSSVTAPGQDVTSTYDGSLVIKDTFSGAAAGTLERTYDDDFRVTGTKVGNVWAFRDYDVDGLPIQAGDLSISRAPNGLVTGTQLDAVTTEQGSDEYGEPVAWTLRGPTDNVLWSETVERDRAGRITKAGATTYERTNGRLTKESGPNGTVEYAYDVNGNMSRVGNGGATFGADDRLLQWGATTFTYQPSGELKSRTERRADDRLRLRRARQPALGRQRRRHVDLHLRRPRAPHGDPQERDLGRGLHLRRGDRPVGRGRRERRGPEALRLRVALQRAGVHGGRDQALPLRTRPSRLGARRGRRRRRSGQADDRVRRLRARDGADGRGLPAVRLRRRPRRRRLGLRALRRARLRPGDRPLHQQGPARLRRRRHQRLRLRGR